MRFGKRYGIGKGLRKRAAHLAIKYRSLPTRSASPCYGYENAVESAGIRAGILDPTPFP